MSYYTNPFNTAAKKKKKKKTVDVLYHFLSGLNKNRIGGNTSIFEMKYDDDTTYRAMVDPGDLFGDEKNPEHPALKDCDIAIADMRAYFNHPSEGKATSPLDCIILSHSHRDHIGAVSKMILMGYEMPMIYATPYTKQRLYQHLQSENIAPQDWPKVCEVAPGQRLKFPNGDIGFFSVSHSTPQSLGLVFNTDQGNIVHTCDWKMDDTLIWGPCFDQNQYQKMTGGSITALLMDSTGADSDKKPVTEKDFRKTLKSLLKKHPDKRFIIAANSGFEENLASIAKVTAQSSRDLFIDGWSHERVFAALHATGLKLADHIGEDIKVKPLTQKKNLTQMKSQAPAQSVVIVAGAMGQRNAALAKAAYGQSKYLDLDPEKDIILFCAPNIPGPSGEQKYALMAHLKDRGFQVFAHPQEKLYPHAHARRSEIIDLIKMSAPKAVIPVHGDEKLRQKNKDLIESLDIKSLKPDNGQSLRLKNGRVSIAHDQTKPAHFIGFETRTGSFWSERDYIVTTTVTYRETPANENISKPVAKEKRRPRIFFNK